MVAQFRVGLHEVRQAIETLEQEKDFTETVTWTERASAQQYYDSLDIAQHPETKEKWLEAERRRIERRARTLWRLSLADRDESGEGGEEM